MDKVRAFNLPVDDMQRARRFYEKVFGWDIHPIPGSGGDFHAAHTVPVDENDEPNIRGAINGGLFKRGTHGLRETFLEITVPSIDEYLRKILAEGCEIVRPKSPMLDFAYYAIIKDTEGNAIGLWEDIVK